MKAPKNLKSFLDVVRHNKEVLIPCVAAVAMLAYAVGISLGPAKAPVESPAGPVAWPDAAPKAGARETAAKREPPAAANTGSEMEDLMALLSQVAPEPAIQQFKQEVLKHPALAKPFFDFKEDQESEEPEQDIEELADKLTDQKQFRQLAAKFYSGEPGFKQALLTLANENPRAQAIIARQLDRVSGKRASRTFMTARSLRRGGNAGPAPSRFVQGVAVGSGEVGDIRAAVSETQSARTVTAAAGATLPLTPPPVITGKSAAGQGGAGAGGEEGRSDSGAPRASAAGGDIKEFGKAAKEFAVQGPVVRRRYLLCAVRAYRTRYNDAHAELRKVVRAVDETSLPYFRKTYQDGEAMTLLGDLRAEVDTLRKELRKSEIELEAGATCFKKHPLRGQGKKCYARVQGPIGESGAAGPGAAGPGPDQALQAILGKMDSKGRAKLTAMEAEPKAKRAKAFLGGQISEYEKALKKARRRITSFKWGQEDVVMEQWPQFSRKYRAVLEQLNALALERVDEDHVDAFATARKGANESLANAKTAWQKVTETETSDHEHLVAYIDAHRFMQAAVDQLSDVCVALGLPALPRADKPDVDGDGAGLLIETRKCDPQSFKKPKAAGKS